MKFFVVCLIVALAVSTYGLTDEEKQKVKSYSSECKTSTGVKPEYVSQIKTDKVFVEGDAKFDDYCACMMKKIKFMNEDGSVNIDNIKARIPSDVDKTKAVPRIEKCANIQAGASTACKVAKCLAESKYKITTVHV